MHLLVLSAFRPDGGRLPVLMVERLNAPSGAQCFPTCSPILCNASQDWFQCTFWCSVLSDTLQNGLYVTSLPVSMHLLVLSAFRPGNVGQDPEIRYTVSMHLLVLSAFRHTNKEIIDAVKLEFQCTFWCSVLSDLKRVLSFIWIFLFQCTFWCSVLSNWRRSDG